MLYQVYNEVHNYLYVKDLKDVTSAHDFFLSLVEFSIYLFFSSSFALFNQTL